METCECGSTDLVHDASRGDLICRECGVVMISKMVTPTVDRTERQFYGDPLIIHHHRNDPLVNCLGSTFNYRTANDPLKRRTFWRLSGIHNQMSPKIRVRPKRISVAFAKIQSGNGEYIPDGYFDADFRKIAEKVGTQQSIIDTGILIIQRLLRPPRESENAQNAVSKADRRSMNSSRTSFFWATSLLILLFKRFQIFKRRAEIIKVIGVDKKHTKKVNTYTYRLGTYAHLYEPMFSPHLRQSKVNMPSQLSDLISSLSDRIDPNTLDKVEELMQVIQMSAQSIRISGRAPKSVLFAIINIVQELQGIPSRASELCKMGGLTQVTLRNNVQHLSESLGIFSLVGYKNRVKSHMVRTWLETHGYGHIKFLDEQTILNISEYHRYGRVLLINPIDVFCEFLGIASDPIQEDVKRHVIDQLLLMTKRGRTQTRLLFLKVLVDLGEGMHSFEEVDAHIPNSINVRSADYWTTSQNYDVIECQKPKGFSESDPSRHRKCSYFVPPHLFAFVKIIIDDIFSVPRGMRSPRLEAIRATVDPMTVGNVSI